LNVASAVSETFRQAAEALNRGDLVGARRQAEAALAAQPESPQVLQLLGVICCQAGEFRKGAGYLRRALLLAPDDFLVRFNLAKALIDQGSLDEASEVFEQGVAADDIRADVWRMRAAIAKAKGDAGGAAEANRRALKSEPQNAEAWNNLGTSLLAVGDAVGAIKALETAKRLAPGDVRMLLNLGKAYVAADRHQDAIDPLLEAAQSAPHEALYQLELGRALNRIGQNTHAIGVLSDAARLDPRNPEILVAIALTFASLGEFGRAEEGYRVALHVDPKYLPALLNLGILLEQGNRLEELEQLVALADEEGVNGEELDFIRALLLRRKGNLQEAFALARWTSPEHVDPNIRGRLIGQLADSLDDADTAFAAFEEMNRATARDPNALAFDGSEHRHYVEGLAKLTTPEWIASWPKAAADSEPPSPVFLVGFPRSGTTLLDTILMGHPATHVLEEEPLLAQIRDEIGGIEKIPDLSADDVHRVRAGYFAKLQEISPAPPGKLVIDKLPLNLLRTPLIHRLFPDAKFLFALRHPCDTVLSCWMQNFRINQAMASFLDLTNAALFYDRVMSYWLQCQHVMPINLHVIRYETLVEDLEGAVRPLIDYLSLDWDDQLLDYRQTAAERELIRTPSYAQVTEPIYTRSSGRWQRYREHMKDVLPILDPWALGFGYGSVLDSAT
jgi:Flp pilus assembly protein TadD